MKQIIPRGLLTLKTIDLLLNYNGIDICLVENTIQNCGLAFIDSISTFHGIRYPSDHIGFIDSLEIDRTFTPDEISDLTFQAMDLGATHYCMRTSRGRPYEINLIVDYLFYPNYFPRLTQLPK